MLKMKFLHINVSYDLIFAKVIEKINFSGGGKMVQNPKCLGCFNSLWTIEGYEE